jgi:hypothetical protein
MELIGPSEQYVAPIQKVGLPFDDVSLVTPIEQTNLDRVTVRVRLQWGMDFVVMIASQQ